MTRPTAQRKALAAVAMMLVTFALGVAGAVVAAHPAAASGAATSSACAPTTSTTSTMSTSASSFGPDPNSPAAKFFVINGTSGAASDHEIVGSSAFPNYSTGAVDNWYSLAHAHVDNSPFAEGLASPFDTGPIGQTAAAGNTQQPQYADARWPGDTCHATYGSEGGPYAVADVSDYHATANASEASNGFAVPKGFDGRLQQALAAWELKWAGPLSGISLPKVKVPKVKVPNVPSVKVPTPAKTVSTPAVTVPTPAVPLPGGTPAVPATPATPATPVQAPTPAVPSVASAHGTSQPPRTLAGPGSGDGEGLLESSVTSMVDKKTNALVTSGESSVGRVSIGGGQIVLQKIHVTAEITNDGTKATPDYKANVTLGSASIAGYPVTIDKDGVHLVGQTQGLPFQQASDGLNAALKQAGIQLFLVSPEVTQNANSSCGSPGGAGTGSGSGTGSTPLPSGGTSSTSTTPSDQSGTGMGTGSCGPCDQSGSGAGTYPGPTTGSGTSNTSTTTNNTSTTSSDQSGMGSSMGSCDQSGMGTTCDQSGTGSGTGTTTGTTTTTSGPTTPSLGAPGKTSTGTTTTPNDQSGTTGSCDQTGMPPSTSGCAPKMGKGKGKSTGTTTTSTDQTGTTPMTSPGSPMDVGSGAGSAGEETVIATGVHVLFTQPVDPSGVPAQNIEHILGEVFIDSLAQPAGKLPNLNSSSPSSSTLSSSSSSACGKGKSSGFKSAGGSASTAGGSSSSTSGGGGGGALGSSAGGSSMTGGSGSPSGSTLGSSSSQPTGTSTGNSVPAMFASALKKPLWLLIAYLLWQVLVIGTGASLWSWNKEGS